MPVVDGLPRPVVRGYVAPWQTTAGPPEHPVDHRAVIGPPATPLRLLAGQQRLQPGPFLVGQIVSIEHTDGLPHPPVKIRGTRSSRQASSLGLEIERRTSSGCWSAPARANDTPHSRCARGRVPRPYG